MIADFERQEFTVAPCAWPATFQQNLVAIVPPGQKDITGNNAKNTSEHANSDHKVSIGPIAGGAGGGLVVLIAAAVCFWFFYWRKRHGKLSKDELSASHEETSAFNQNGAIGVTEMEAKHYAELHDGNGNSKDYKYEMVGTPAGSGPQRQEMDTYMPVGNELESVHVYEMPAEAVASEMGMGSGRPATSEAEEVSPALRSAGLVSPLSGTEGGSPGLASRKGTSPRSHHNY